MQAKHSGSWTKVMTKLGFNLIQDKEVALQEKE